MMLKQTVESPDRKAVFYPGGKNSAVQLGSYQEMVFHRDQTNKIAFEYQWSLQNVLKFKDPVSGQSFSGNGVDFEAEVELSDSKQNLLQVKRFKYRLLDNERQALAVELARKTDKREYAASSEQYSLVRKKMRAWALKEVVRFYGFPDEAVAYYQNAEFVQALNIEHEKLFKSIHYLGPLRTKTDRLYTWAGITPESVGFSGENTVAAILAARDRKISLGLQEGCKTIRGNSCAEAHKRWG